MFSPSWRFGPEKTALIPRVISVGLTPCCTDLVTGGAEIVTAAGERWRIPVAVVDADPGQVEKWVDAMTAAAERLIGAGRLG